VADQPEGLLNLLALIPRVERYERMKPGELTKLSYSENLYIDRISGKNKLPENHQWA
jgi:hypothetical protein